MEASAQGLRCTKQVISMLADQPLNNARSLPRWRL